MYGAWLIDSIPPATTTSNSSVATAWAASITALRPEPHLLLMVIAPAETGIPAKMPACGPGRPAAAGWRQGPVGSARPGVAGVELGIVEQIEGLALGQRLGDRARQHHLPAQA